MFTMQYDRSLVVSPACADDLQLGNQSTGMHFHGMFQNGTNEMDGAVAATQCAIPPGSAFTYNFTASPPDPEAYQHANVSSR